MCKHHDNPVDNRCRIRSEYVRKFPGLAVSDPALIDAFTDYRMALDSGKVLREAPLVPARITARHPLAH